MSYNNADNTKQDSFLSNLKEGASILESPDGKVILTDEMMPFLKLDVGVTRWQNMENQRENIKKMEGMYMDIESYCGEYNGKYLSELIQIEKEIFKAQKCGEYIDPDGTYNDKNSDYYEKLVKFLNQQEQNQEQNYIDKENRWTYIFKHDYPQCIEATKDKKHVLYLRSDQFGFSAPKLYNEALSACDKRYPYWNYLINSDDKEKVENVINWVRTSRTIGGSFIWPIWKNGDKYSSSYNLNRGVGSYIEDSVDLTLFEVKNYYTWKKNGEKDIIEYEYKNDILWESELQKEGSTMVKWLNHFGDFENFIDYFLMKDFVIEQGNEYIPMDITTGEKLTDNLVKEYRESYKKKNKLEIQGRIMDKKPYNLREMLKRLEECIENRSQNLENVNSKYKCK